MNDHMKRKQKLQDMRKIFKKCKKFQNENKNINIDKFIEKSEIIQKEIEELFPSIYYTLNEDLELFHDGINIRGINLLQTIISDEAEYFKNEEFKKFQKEILTKQQEHNDFQKDIMKEDLKYKEKLDEDNKNIKKFTLVLALGIIAEIYLQISNLIISLNTNILAVWAFKAFSLVIFLLFLFKALDILELRGKFFSDYNGWKTSLSFWIIIGIIGLAIVLQIFIPSLVTPKETNIMSDNLIYLDLKFEQEKVNNLTLNLRQINSKYNNLENCLIELENKNQTNFKICLIEKKE